MLKAFGKLWLRGAKQLAKAQQSQQKKLQKKLVKALVGAPAKKVRTAVKRVVKAVVPAAPARAAAKSGARRKAAASAAPALGISLSAGGSWTRSGIASLTVDAGMKPRRLTGWLYIPALAKVAAPTAATPAASMPLVVMLHGCDQTAPEFASGTRMNQLALRHGFAVLYPQQSASAHPQRCWPWYQRSVQRGGNEVALVAGMIEKAIAAHGFDSTRVYVAGMSAGAALAQTLALRRPDLIAAVASHSGPLFGVADSRMSALATMQRGAANPAQPIAELQRNLPDFPGMPALILQGAQDSVVRPVNARQLQQQFCLLNRLAGAAAQPVVERAARGASDAVRITDHRAGRRLVVRLVEVAHLGHAWSGGDASLRYNAARGPDASAVLWDFFKRHRRPASRPVEPVAPSFT